MIFADGVGVGRGSALPLLPLSVIPSPRGQTYGRLLLVSLSLAVVFDSLRAHPMCSREQDMLIRPVGHRWRSPSRHRIIKHHHGTGPGVVHAVRTRSVFGHCGPSALLSRVSCIS
jgi:hypothetical protein